MGCCHREERKPTEVWIRALGLPLHLWSKTVSMEIGKRCGGFVTLDEATKHNLDLRWPRILVQFKEHMPACVVLGSEVGF